MDSAPDCLELSRVPDDVLRGEAAPASAPVLEPEARALALSAQYADADAMSLLRVALGLFGDRIALVSSFGAESAVLLHMVAEIDRATPVIFIDTGRLFAQTLLYRHELARRLGLTNIRTAEPNAAAVRREDPDRLLAYSAPDLCCWIRKVEPLDAALEPFEAWITGRKRHQASTRSALAPFEAEAGRIKVNPLAGWSARDLADYMDRHALPPHPLVADGYPSIGCAPCTSRVAAGEDPRAGRWRGSAKVECGIHKEPTQRLGSGI